MAQFDGIFRATVLNSLDPMRQGRVQVSVPAVSGGATQWALPCREPGTGLQRPTPNTGDTAWVMFEGGDPTRPVWLGVM